MGPVASQEAIKMLGTNGGGFFNANSSHPFENPTALTNFVQMLAIFLIPTALCFAFGDVVNDRRRPYAAVGHVVNLRDLRSTGDVGRMVRQQPLYAAGANSNINWKAKRAASAFLPAVSMRWSPRRLLRGGERHA